MNFIFLGSDAFAAGILDNLVRLGKVPQAVCTYPPKMKGRGHEKKTNAVADCADLHGIRKVLHDDFNSLEAREELRSLNPELGIVIAFHILEKETFSIPKLGTMNLHPSLLPELRGAAPLNWSIRRGYTKSGFTTFFLEDGIDCGKILMQEPFDIDPDEKFSELSERLKKTAAEHLVKALDKLESGKYSLTAQTGKPTSAPKIAEKHLVIDWTKSAVDIHNQIRAFSPLPGTFTTYLGKKIKVIRSRLFVDKIFAETEELPGTILKKTQEGIVVNTGDGLIELLSVIPEGKKMISGKDFYIGYLKNEKRFGKY